MSRTTHYHVYEAFPGCLPEGDGALSIFTSLKDAAEEAKQHADGYRDMNAQADAGEPPYYTIRGNARSGYWVGWGDYGSGIGIHLDQCSDTDCMAEERLALLVD